jgi:hypothetical protein
MHGPLPERYENDYATAKERAVGSDPYLPVPTTMSELLAESFRGLLLAFANPWKERERVG